MSGSQPHMVGVSQRVSGIPNLDDSSIPAGAGNIPYQQPYMT